MYKRAKESNKFVRDLDNDFFSWNEAHRRENKAPPLLCPHKLHSHIKDWKERKKERRYNSILVSGISDSTREFVRIDGYCRHRIFVLCRGHTQQVERVRSMEQIRLASTQG